MDLADDIEKQVESNVAVFFELGLIGQFQGMWPSLGEPHNWVSEIWEPLVKGCI